MKYFTFHVYLIKMEQKNGITSELGFQNLTKDADKINSLQNKVTRLESFNALKDKTIDDLNFQIKKLNDENKMLNEFVQSQMKIIKELDERFHKCNEIMIQLSSRKGGTNQSDTETQNDFINRTGNNDFGELLSKIREEKNEVKNQTKSFIHINSAIGKLNKKN